MNINKLIDEIIESKSKKIDTKELDKKDIYLVESEGFKSITSKRRIDNNNIPWIEKNNIFTTNNIKMWMKYTKQNCELLDDSVNLKQPANFYCNIHNNKFSAIISNINNDSNLIMCEECFKEYQRNKFKADFDKVKSCFESRGLTVLDDDYTNAKTKINCIDNSGYKYVVTYDSFKNSSTKPSIVGKTNPYAIENIKLWLKLNNPKYKLISNQYINSHDLLGFECEEHGRFSMCWGNISQGQSCPRCADIIRLQKAELQRLNIEDVKLNVTNKINSIEVISEEWISSKNKIKCFCKTCNTKFDSLYNNLMKGQGCPVCGLRKGENHGSWKGGITPLHNHLRAYILPWKQDSFKKYNYRCDISGINDKTLIIHHTNKNFSDILQETIDTLDLPIYKKINEYTNEELKLIEDTCLKLHYKYGLGVCLTEELHKEFHSIYGIKNNTLEQWIEFKENKLKELTQGENYKNE